MEATDTLNFMDTTGEGGGSFGGFALLSSPLPDEVIAGLTNHFCIEEVMRAMQEKRILSALPSTDVFFDWPDRLQGFLF